MAEKRPAETSTEEPVSKKQVITTEMYEELKGKIVELEKRNIEAQEMTQKQIEKFQERTAVSKEKLEKIKKLAILIQENEQQIEMWNSFKTELITNYILKSGCNGKLKTELNKIIQTKYFINNYQLQIRQLLDINNKK
jgi:hypothetical protein